MDIILKVGDSMQVVQAARGVCLIVKKALKCSDLGKPKATYYTTENDQIRIDLKNANRKIE